MNRRSFMTAILASGVAPYVVTSAGVLMPVHALAVPAISWLINSDNETVHLRLGGVSGAEIIREVSRDGKIWVRDDALTDFQAQQMVDDLNSGAEREWLFQLVR